MLKLLLAIPVLAWLYRLLFGTADWTAPITWTSALVTVDQLNEQVRNNLEYLFSPNSDVTDYDEGTDKTTTSTSFVAVDTAGAPDLRATLVTEGEDVAVSFLAEVQITNSGSVEGNANFNILVDGTTLAIADDGIFGAGDNVANAIFYELVSFRIIIAGLSAGTHTFDVMWKVSASAPTTTATMYAGAGTVRHDTRPQLDVRKA